QNTILRYGRLKICATTYEISELRGLSGSSIQQDCQGRVKPGQTWSNLKFFPNPNLDRTGRVFNTGKQRKIKSGPPNVAAAMRRTFVAPSSACQPTSSSPRPSAPGEEREKTRAEMSIGTSLTTVVNCELISVCT